MSWQAIAETDLITRFSSTELEAIRAAALGVGQADPVAATIAQVVSKVRMAIASSTANTLSSTATQIPSGLLSAALDLIVLELMKRPGCTIIDNGNVRKDAARTAEDYLARVASGAIRIDDPDSGSVMAARPSIEGKDLSFGNTSQDGL